MDLQIETDVRCSPAVLWQWLTEPERMKQWIKGFVSVEPSDPRVTKAGMTAKVTMQDRGKLVVCDERILEWEPHRRILLSLTTPQWSGIEMVLGYRLEDLGGSTRLVHTFGCRTTRTLFKVIKVLATPFTFLAKMQARGTMKTLKRLAEGGSVAVTAA